MHCSYTSRTTAARGHHVCTHAASRMHGILDASLDPRFLDAYEQVSLDVHLGGHGLRNWAAHADAAFVGQWSLTCQSALVPASCRRFDGELYFLVLRHVVHSAAGRRAMGGEGRSDLPIVVDLARAVPGSRGLFD